MKSVYVEFPQKGAVAVREESVTAAGLARTEALIRGEASIISAGTELARMNGIEEGCTFPFRPGYGMIGRIEAKGEGIGRFEVGDRVFFAGKHASVQRFTDGADHQWGCLFPVPEEIDPIEASVGCMAQIAMTAPNVTELKMGDTVAVFGLGMVGILAGLLFRLKGANVIGVDPVRERCELARKAGIDTVVDAAPERQVDAIRELTGGRGADAAVDATGVTAVVGNCVRAAATLGQVVLLGTPRAPHAGNVTEWLHDVHERGLVVRGAHMWRMPVRSQRGVSASVEWAFATVFDLIRTRKLDVRQLISHVVKPAQVPSAYDGLQHKRSEYTCAVIDWRP